MPSEDNKRIAKNTLFLYLRMVLTIAVNFISVRVIWQVLGVDNYGIYNVVGGIVLMFSALNSAMVGSSQRYLSFELGRGDMNRLNKVFCISITVHIIIAIIIFILAETIGLWFLNYKLNIPENRMIASNWVYQCSILAFLFNIVSVPYNACIVAHEHMKAYGYFGIIEVLLKLSIIYLLLIIPGDKLIVYALLVLGVQILMRIGYQIYCHHYFQECEYHKVSNNSLLKEMLVFAKWTFVGTMGFTIRDQGISIILNLFFNVAVNAARGITNQIGIAITGFASNFQMALNPQITKRYANGQIKSMMGLVFNGCKYSVLLMTIIVIPLIISSESILKLWLGEITEYTSGFLKLTLWLALIESIIGPITTALQADGNIKIFQILISIILILILPISWVFLTIWKDPYIVLYVTLAMTGIGILTRLILLHRIVHYEYKRFIYIILKCALIVVCSYFLSSSLYSQFRDGFINLIIFIVLSCLMTISLIILLGLNKNEKEYFYGIFKSKILRRNL